MEGCLESYPMDNALHLGSTPLHHLVGSVCTLWCRGNRTCSLEVRKTKNILVKHITVIWTIIKLQCKTWIHGFSFRKDETELKESQTYVLALMDTEQSVYLPASHDTRYRTGCFQLDVCCWRMLTHVQRHQCGVMLQQ